MDDQKYLNEYLNSVNGDSSLTQDSKDLIAKHIHGLRAFVQQRQEADKNQPQKSVPEVRHEYQNQPNVGQGRVEPEVRKEYSNKEYQPLQ